MGCVVAMLVYRLSSLVKYWLIIIGNHIRRAVRKIIMTERRGRPATTMHPTDLAFSMRFSFKYPNERKYFLFIFSLLLRSYEYQNSIYLLTERVSIFF